MTLTAPITRALKRHHTIHIGLLQSSPGLTRTLDRCSFTSEVFKAHDKSTIDVVSPVDVVDNLNSVCIRVVCGHSLMFRIDIFLPPCLVYQQRWSDIITRPYSRLKIAEALPYYCSIITKSEQWLLYGFTIWGLVIHCLSSFYSAQYLEPSVACFLGFSISLSRNLRQLKQYIIVHWAFRLPREKSLLGIQWTPAPPWKTHFEPHFFFAWMRL